MNKVLITGNQRSGTTLLQIIISSFKNINICHEEKNPFSGIPPNEIKANKIYVRKCPQGQYIDQSQRYLGDFLKREKIMTIGDVINDNWKVVYISRDGRDTCVSKHGLNNDVYWARPWQWIASHDNAKKFYNNEKLLFIKYEELVQNHNEIVSKIEKFIGSKSINYNEHYKKFSKNTQVKNAVKKLRPIDDNSVGNWKNDEHRDRIKQILEEHKEDFCRVLIELGYEKDDAWCEGFK